MAPSKTDVQNLLNKLPDNVTLEDIQYHLYVLEKRERGIQRGEEEGWIDNKDQNSFFSCFTFIFETDIILLMKNQILFTLQERIIIMISGHTQTFFVKETPTQ